MIELKGLRKAYQTGDFVQKALDGVTLTLRDNEFVAVLGQSGSGKTTLLNVLGGLDHADSGDIVINGVSTRNYRAKDWDAYRNHRIGFIFQSYNLIPHQTILSNVELALTLSGVGRAERHERAAEALKRVGLGEHINKRPNQLSGGQMQRVAIARALVNDPDIVLADEPTGALDTDTGVQVMEILKQVAQDRLVVMVTHNPDLAEQYATRIVRLADGRVIDDSDPCGVPDAEAANEEAVDRGVEPAFVPLALEGMGSQDQSEEQSTAQQQAFIPGGPRPAKGADPANNFAPPTGPAQAEERASMSFLTALSLSFNNLMTKKGRTALTAFAGSIGIIGIAAILALSNGVNNYIAKTEEEALSSYPLTITKSSFDMGSLMTASMGYSASGDAATEQGRSSADEGSLDDAIPESHIMSDMFATVKTNNLSAFREYIESGSSDIKDHVNAVQYNYNVTPQVYAPAPESSDTEDVSSDTPKMHRVNPSDSAAMFSSGFSSPSMTGSSSGYNSFYPLIDNEKVRDSQMTLVEGHWPESAHEAVLVLNNSGQISDYTLYSIGVYDSKELADMMKDAFNGKEVTVPEKEKDFTYNDALQLTYQVLPASSLYQKNTESGTWTDMSKDDDYIKDKLESEGITLLVVGVVKPAEGGGGGSTTEGIAYSSALTFELMDRASQADIVKEQLDHPDVDVFTGKTFDELKDEQGEDFDMSELFSVDEEAMQRAFSFDTSALSNMGSGGLDPSALALDPSAFDASALDPSALSVDPSALEGVFNEETMRQIMAGAPQFSMQDALTNEGVTSLTEEQQQQLRDVSNKLSAGFLAWYVTPVEAGGYGKTMQDFAQNADFSSAFQTYLQTPQAQAITAPVMESFGQVVQDRINLAMQDYMTNQFAPYLSEAFSALMQQAAQTMALSMAQSMQSQMAAMTSSMGSQLSQAISGSLQSQMAGLQSAMENGFSFDADAFANAIQFNMTQEDLTSLLTNYMNADQLTYDDNMTKLGYATADEPNSISLYPVDFPAKEAVLASIDDYNTQVNDAGENDKAIQYSDLAGVLMRSVTDIVNMISLVLIAFVSISLVVSSIMIAIITYISVLERRKEIGILRAIGASKGNVGSVFNAETVIEGLIAGVFAIGLVVLVSIPVNATVEQLFNVSGIMSLPIVSGLILIGVSVLLTFIAGLIPASMASRRDPVEALRSE